MTIDRTYRTLRNVSFDRSDVLLGLAAATLVVVGSTLAGGARPLDLLGYGLLLAPVAVTARRHWSPAVLAVAIGCALVYDTLDYPGAFYTVTLAMALHATVAARRRTAAIAAAGGVFVTFVAVDLLFARGHIVDAEGGLFFAGFLTLGVVLGEVTRGRRAYLDEAEQRALQAERTREEEAQRRAAQERMRIARELHDVLAHRISLINVQAGVGAHLAEADPQRATAALQSIKVTSKEALRELRATLGVLRGIDEGEPLAPTPSLAGVDELVQGASAAGLRVGVAITGEARDLPADIDLAAYRIVQESLTNVTRHGEANAAAVAIHYGTDAIVVEVTDDGRGATGSQNGDGHRGILGMRERAAAAGGELEAGDGKEGGFRVRARLPLESP